MGNEGPLTVLNCIKLIFESNLVVHTVSEQGDPLDGTKFQHISAINSVAHKQKSLAGRRPFERKKLTQKHWQICQAADLWTKNESNLIVHTVSEPGDPLDGTKFQHILAINSVTHTQQSLAGRRPFERKKLTQKP